MYTVTIVKVINIHLFLYVSSIPNSTKIDITKVIIQSSLLTFWINK